MIRGLVASLALAQPALAEPWACAFTARCLAGLACEAANLELQVIAADHEGQLFFLLPTEDAPVVTLSPRAYATEDRLLTITPEGTATLTSHRDAIASFFGTCEVLE